MYSMQVKAALSEMGLQDKVVQTNTHTAANCDSPVGALKVREFSSRSEGYRFESWSINLLHLYPWSARHLTLNCPGTVQATNTL